MAKLKIAVICSSNMNRSMEAHSVLSKRSFTVDSYGTGDKVKIPGKSQREPNIYPFGTTYKEIHSDLIGKDKQLYTGIVLPNTTAINFILMGFLSFQKMECFIY